MAKKTVKKEEKEEGLIIEVGRDALLEGLEKVCGVVAKKSDTMPVLSNVRLQVTQGQLEIIGTDLEIMISTEVGVRELISSPGALTVPGKKLMEMVKELKGTLTLSHIENKLTISTQSGKFEILTLPAEGFPLIEERPEETWGVSTHVLCTLIDKALYAVSTDENRVALCGIHLERTKDGLRATGTDGHRMSQVSVTDPENGIWPEMEKGITIPRRAAAEIRKLLVGRDGINFAVTNKNLIIEAGGTVLYARLIDVEFPNVTQLIPSSAKTTATCDRANLIDTLRRVNVLSHENKLVIRIDKALIVVDSMNPQIGQGEDTIAAETIGPSIEFGINARYLIEALEHISGTEVDIKVTDETGPVQLLGSGAHISIVMPMRA